MKADELWRMRVRDAAQHVLAPLTLDGGVFEYDSFNFENRTVRIRYRLAECEMCSITPEDLTAILYEGLERTVGAGISVQLVEMPTAVE